jgi:asparagine synthase (glutamine-hydrolysing)
MCGIAGFVDPDLPGSAPLETIGAMAETLTRRGPDDRGVWHDAERGVFLGFRRLAILDLSEAGHQPMASASGRWVVVFNGEIYNFAALRAELEHEGHRFRGGSDTEVLLAALEAWGPRATVPRLQGMFAFAAHDREQGALWLARDRMGIKPLYLAHDGQWLAFASEIRALLPHPRITGRGSREAAWHYLRTLYVPAPLSILEGVEKVRPGTVTRFSLDRAGRVVDREDVAYWSLEEVARAGAADPFTGDDDELLDVLHDLLRESVRLRLVADVPVGALLSGGVDSSLVVAVMAELAEMAPRTFTIAFDDPRFDESEKAREVAALLGTRHTTVSMPTSAVRDLIPELGDFSDEPMANPSILPTLLVCQVARRDVTVALTGDGGDELFAGYNRYLHFPALAGRVAPLPGALRPALGRVLRMSASAPGVEWLGGVLQRGRYGEQHSVAARLRRIAGVVGARDDAAAYRELMSVGHVEPPLARPLPDRSDDDAFRRHPGGLVARSLLADQSRYLPDDLLAKVDRASMWASLEARVPLLDHRIVAFSWRIPADRKVSGGVLKRPLRALAARYLPREILDRPKMGFTVPLEGWLRGDLAPWMEERLAPAHLARRGLYDVEAIRRLKGRFDEGAAGLELSMWTLAVLEDWCERRGVTFGG